MAKKFDIPKQSFSSVADAYNGLLGMDNNRVVNLPVSQLDEIDNQPFPINESKVDQIADSIDAQGRPDSRQHRCSRCVRACYRCKER